MGGVDDRVAHQHRHVRAPAEDQHCRQVQGVVQRHPDRPIREICITWKLHHLHKRRPRRVPSSLRSYTIWPNRYSSQFKDTYFTERCSGSDAGSYLRRIDSCITQLKAQGPSRTCTESKKEERVIVTVVPESLLFYSQKLARMTNWSHREGWWERLLFYCQTIGNPLPDAQEPPYVPTVLPIVGSMDDSLAGYSGWRNIHLRFIRDG